MPEFRRRRVAGATYFFTVATARRRPILTTDRARTILRQCISDVQQSRPFTIDAFVLLPDHFHVIWTLPPGDSDYSTRWRLIKGAFTHIWLNSGGGETSLYRGQAAEKRRGVWQPRYYEHTIRNEDDLNEHLDYIHYNPVKHGLTTCPKDWNWSSFHRYVKDGIYPIDWCCGNEPPPIISLNEQNME